MEVLKKKSYRELREICNDMGVHPKSSRQECLDYIISHRYKKLYQLGNKGREARTFLVIDNIDNKEYAMKTYRKNKSTDSMLKEIQFQNYAAKAGISPRIYDYDTGQAKMIIMEKMEEDLVDIINRQKGKMSVSQQKEVINIFKTLDAIGVFHGDANLLNFMSKNNRLYIIDYGFSELINTKNVKKYTSNTPNIDFMPIAFMVQAKRIFPNSKFTYIEKFIKQENASKITLKQI